MAKASSSLPSPPSPAKIAARLSTWFAGAKRELAWRKQRTPYRVWLSEIMLQQTQVAVVERYFAAFTERFADVTALANASEDEVLALWAGLGYYARGRNLHRAAQTVRDEHGGEFPTTAKALQTLPGVGPYTAGAIASLAFGERAAIVDGNVLRVLSRLFNDATPIDSSEGKARAWKRATDLVTVAKDPAVLNEAMMELGALVCTPRSPQCATCPLRRDCVGSAAGNAASLPVKAKKTKRKVVRLATLLAVTDDDRIWLEKQPRNGLFGGLYAPPSVEVQRKADAKQAAEGLAGQRGLSFAQSPAAVTVKRTLTHRELHFFVFLRQLPAPPPSGNWIPRADLDTVGIASAARAVVDVSGSK